MMAMIEHAQKHEEAGYDLPTTWMGITDTFESHKQKTIKSLENPLWKGIWKLSENKHLATCSIDGRVLVHLDLFGIEDEGAKDRVRREAHGAWWEEPAPAAVLVQSSGIDETSYMIGLTSLRMPSYCNPSLLTLNYPDEDHWTWKNFVEEPQPGTQYFRIPPGERASAEDRAEWTNALKNRPDLLRRLLEGKPGTVLLGDQVADGFNEDRHVSVTRLKPIKGEPLFISLDFGHTPAAIIGQSWRGRKLVYAALPCARGGIRQHMRDSVLPWLTVNAPWAIRNESMIQGAYDVSGDTEEQADIDQSPMLVVMEMLPGFWEPGAVSWDGRKGPMLSLLNQAINGDPVLQIDPVDGKPLIQALSGRWYYPKDRLGKVSKDLPKKPNHPWEDLGDSFCYWVGRVAPYTGVERQPARIVSGFDPRVPNVSIQTDFDSRM